MTSRRIQTNFSISPPLRRDESRTLSGVAFPPLVIGGVLLVTLKTGSLQAIDERSGEQLWSIALAEVSNLPPHHGEPLVEDGLIHVCAAGEFLSIDIVSGKIRTRVPAPELDLQLGTFVDGCIVSYVEDERLEAWDIATATLRWSIEQNFDPVPIAGEKNLVVTAGFGFIKALDVRDGHELWTVAVDKDKGIGSIAIAPDGSVIATISEEIACLEGESGSIRWSTESGVVRPETLAVTETSEIHVMDLGSYRRFAAATGSLIASHKFDRSTLPANRWSLGRLSVSRSHVFAADMHGPIIAVSQKTGLVDWEWEEKGSRAASVAPVLADSRLYALDFHGTLECFVAAE